MNVSVAFGCKLFWYTNTMKVWVYRSGLTGGDNIPESSVDGIFDWPGFEPPGDEIMRYQASEADLEISVMESEFK